MGEEISTAVRGEQGVAKMQERDGGENGGRTKIRYEQVRGKREKEIQSGTEAVVPRLHSRKPLPSAAPPNPHPQPYL